MNYYKKIIVITNCTVLSLFLLFSMVWALGIGSVHISYSQIINTLQQLWGSAYTSVDYSPVFDIVVFLRLPRILLAATVGASLAVCGVVMQAIVKNPLADPYVIGISAGASLGATLAIMLGVGIAWGENFIGMAAFIGAFVISMIVVGIANIGGRANSIKLLLAGMSFSAICSSFSGFIVYFANNKEGIQSITYWLMGSLAGAKWEQLAFIIPIVFSIIIFFTTQSRILDLMLLGDDTAITLGRNLHQYRQFYLLLSSLLVGLAVYTSGMIGFVGLIIPHIVRMFCGTSHKNLLPINALAGAIFLVFADALCRSIIPRTEIPIGILVSLLGAPTFMYLMIKRSYGFGGN